MSVSKTLCEAMESLDDVKDKLTDQQYLTIANALRDKHSVENRPSSNFANDDELLNAYFNMNVAHTYKIYCVTEGTYVTGTSQGLPNECYNDCNHEVNTHSAQLIEN